jgi:hypothetical protein
MMEEDDELRRGTVVSTAIDDDILSIPSFGGISVVWKREGIMPKQAFCEMMRRLIESRERCYWNLYIEFIRPTANRYRYSFTVRLAVVKRLL